MTPDQRALLETSSVPSATVQRAIAAALATIAAQREEIERLKAHITEANEMPHAKQLAEHQATICTQAVRAAALEAENARLNEKLSRYSFTRTEAERWGSERVVALEAENAALREALRTTHKRWCDGLECPICAIDALRKEGK